MNKVSKLAGISLAAAAGTLLLAGCSSAKDVALGDVAASILAKARALARLPQVHVKAKTTVKAKDGLLLRKASVSPWVVILLL